MYQAALKVILQQTRIIKVRVEQMLSPRREGKGLQNVTALGHRCNDRCGMLPAWAGIMPPLGSRCAEFSR